MISDLVEQKIRQTLEVDEIQVAPLGGGCVAEVYLVECSKACYVAKTDSGYSLESGDCATGLEIEGSMLRYLAQESSLPVPEVKYSSPGLLLMDFIKSDGKRGVTGEEDAANHIANLHKVQGSSFGFSYDTLIGNLHQPNPRVENWCEFFRDHRILYMARLAYELSNLSKGDLTRVESLAIRLDRYLPVQPNCSLLHGDIWGGNVLFHQGRVAAFIDPAIYFGHHEVELAFITMFQTFSKRFFDIYGELNQIEDGFEDCRRHLYLLYPVLVHIALFGSSYLGSLNRILSRFAS